MLAPLLAGNQENRIALTIGKAKQQPLSLGLWLLREKQNTTASAQPLFRILLTDDVGGYQLAAAFATLPAHHACLPYGRVLPEPSRTPSCQSVTTRFTSILRSGAVQICGDRHIFIA
jgi:hypothetical protein